ncbi:MAG TPA: DUF192 domain-containing protein [Terriglobales bacterium]|nr:DUF192 domain-containing protein [Terriglobales bacterium]
MQGYALNCTRGVFLATEMGIANGFLTRLRGLLTTAGNEFEFGRGLWITPSQGVHALGMRYPIDALYLDREMRVIHIEDGLRPWRLGAVRRRAASVLELPAGAARKTRTAVGDTLRIARGPCLSPVPR